jgi:glucose-6-phosphate 1-dehydrogenase
MNKKILKVLIMGITGDYSRRKIIPSIGHFVNNFNRQVELKLLGFSRSVIDKQTVTDLLGLDDNLSVDTVLETGDYSDITFFLNQIQNLQDNEKFICYLALPPSVYLDFLKKVCLITKKDFTILIEKPFGRNAAESAKISQTVMDCKLYNKVFFVDHYLFKPSSRVDVKHLLTDFELSFDSLESIEIKALEQIGVEGRLGYYDQTGALNDMFPHLYSLFNQTLAVINPSFTVSSWKVLGHQSEQYPEYLLELSKANILSSTETYFKTLAAAYFPNKTINITFESGKKQKEKRTEITLNFGNITVSVGFAPECEITITKDGKLIHSIPILDSKFTDHERMLMDLIENNHQYFIKADKIIQYWDVIEKIKDFNPKII